LYVKLPSLTLQHLRGKLSYNKVRR
jgi:hypothetical protein